MVRLFQVYARWKHEQLRLIQWMVLKKIYGYNIDHQKICAQKSCIYSNWAYYSYDYFTPSINSSYNDSENPNMANFEPQYAASPGIPKLAANDATFTI